MLRQSVGAKGMLKPMIKKISVDFSSPGSGKPGTNPEQLFACGYGACFGGALAFIARQQKLDIGTPNIRVDVHLHQDDGGFFISAVLDVALPQLDHAEAVKLVELTHAFCPYSKATRGNIQVDLRVNGEPLKAAA